MGIIHHVAGSRPTLGAALVTVALCCPVSGSAVESEASAERRDGPSRADLFERNEGQFRSGVDYLARARGLNVALAESPVLELYRRVESTADDDEARAAIRRLRLEFLGAGDPERVEARQPARARVNYIRGNDREQWRTDVPTFRRVRYAGMYPGIDVDYYMDGGRFEFALRVQPGAEPRRARFDYAGVEQVRITESGQALLDLGDRNLRLSEPVAFQIVDGERQPVEVSYQRRDRGIGFAVGEYDSANTLIIDPVLDYSSYYGGSGTEHVGGVHTDSAGDIYMIGETTSTGLATAGAFRTGNTPGREEVSQTITCPMCNDGNAMDIVERTEIEKLEHSVFVSKFSSSGDTLLYTTYFNAGGNAQQPMRIGVNSSAVNSGGEVAFALTPFGRMPSNLPLQNPVQNHGASQSNGYVAKLSSDGSSLVFGGYFQLASGTSFGAIVRGLDINDSGEVVVVGGVVEGNNFPENNVIPGQSCDLSASPDDVTDSFILYLSASGTNLTGTCIGGETPPASGSAFVEWQRGVTFGDNGHIYTVGYSANPDYPTTMDAIQPAPGYSGSRDMTITEVDPTTTGATIEYATFLGPSTAGNIPNQNGVTSQSYFPIDIEVNSVTGEIIVTGTTNELNFPLESAFQPTIAHPETNYGYGFPGAGQDIYVTKFIPATGDLVFSTYLGGSDSEQGLHEMERDPFGNIYILTVTSSSDYPLLAELDGTLNGETDLGLTKLTPEGRLAFSTYLGGSDDDMIQEPGGLAVPDNDTIIVAAETRANDFPTVDPLQAANAGEVDATLSIIDQSGDTDVDQDGVIDPVDPFPNDATEWRDTDSDGTGNNADMDDDGDGADDSADLFPLDASEQADADGDGAGDNLDLFGGDNTGAFDLDNDGTHDFGDNDSDGDGAANADEDDEFILDPNEVRDFDSDGVGDNADPDADSDGTPDAGDPAVFNANEPVVTFNLFRASNTVRWLDPLPQDFSTPAGADTAWTTALDQAFSGDISLGSLNPGAGGSALVQMDRTFPAGRLQFRYKVDSEAGGDFLDFSIDGTNELSASGDTGWQLFTAPIAAGAHTLEWDYNKDGAGDVGFDATWIDDVHTRTDIGDLSVTIDNGLLTVPGGNSVTYAIEVTNHGPSNITGVDVSAMIPSELMNANWSCSSTPNALCGTAGGSGDVNLSVDLDVSASVTIDVTADAQSGPEEPVSFLAQITVPAAFTDTNAGNNNDLDEDMVGVFGTGFEPPPGL